MFSLGTVRPDDSFKYPIPRFGYPPMVQPQQMPTTPSYQDQSNPISYSTAKSTDPIQYSTTKSVDPMSWSATAQLARRPSLTPYSNRYERHAKEGFAYWPTDVEYKKPRCKSFFEL